MPNKRKIINDPVHGFITLPNDLVYDVLQHPFVQRLGRIRQLGLSCYVYPGAVHTRFGHSLGAMFLMQEAISTLRLKGVPISDSEAMAAEIAILLHDIGHGPFSHVLEHTLVEHITHEEISLLMMQQINSDLRKAMDDGQLAINGDSGPLDEAIAIFKDEYPRHFLHQLISSQLDMDRMDYLCRDSFFCGVQEGRIASERMIKLLNVVEDKLVLEHKGIYSVEKFLIARRLMYWQVYLHKTSVAAEQLLISVLTRAKELAGQGIDLFCSPALHYFLYNRIGAQDFYESSKAMEQYALLDDSDVLSAIKTWMSHEDKVLRLLSQAFINRRLFRATPLDQPLTPEEKQQLEAHYVQKYGITPQDARYFYMEHLSTKSTYSEKDDSIMICYADGTVKDIAEASEILDLQSLTRKPKKWYLLQYRDE